MTAHLLGIHHVTAIATDPQRNLDFYTQVLGLRLVKRTVNFDDPGTYHFYFGDETGRPGTILTFFPWPMARRGSRGAGQVTVTSFSVPEDSLGMWSDRLGREGVIVEEIKQRFEEEVLTLLDPDGLKLELVAQKEAVSKPFWAGGEVPETMAVRGFQGVTLTLEGYESTADLLTGVMGFHHAAEERNRFRFKVDAPGPGVLIDLLCSPDSARGRVAAGTVHHVAFRVGSNSDQLECREILAGGGMDVTPVLDRNYFRSIYFREPGRVLFEIATDPPGFTADEPVEDLGSGLKLPEWLEPRRRQIEDSLPPLVLRR
jgi:glyoxalase family protein